MKKPTEFRRMPGTEFEEHYLVPQGYRNGMELPGRRTEPVENERPAPRLA